MRKLFLLMIPLMMMGCWSIPFLTPSSLPKWDEIETDIINLYEANDLENWVVMGNPAGFEEMGTVLRSEGGKGGNWLRSKELYSDFVLRLEYRISPGGNSGVFFRCTEDGNPWETGYEAQISNEQPPRDLSHCTGSLYGYVAVDPRPDESPEVWHSYQIVCKQSRILVFVDGINTVDVDINNVDALQNKPMSGYIGLQDSHAAEGSWVEFRNIQIRKL